MEESEVTEFIVFVDALIKRFSPFENSEKFRVFRRKKSMILFRLLRAR